MAKPISIWRCPGDGCWFRGRHGSWSGQKGDKGFACRVGRENQYLSMYLCMHVCRYVCSYICMYLLLSSIIYHLFICHLSSFYLYPSVLAMQEAAHWPNGFLTMTMRARLSEYAASWMPEKVGRTCVLDDTCSLWGLPPCSGLLLPLAVHFLTVWASLG